MANDTDSKFAQLMIIGVTERLRRSDNNGLSRMDTQRVEVLHVTNGDTVVKAVAHHLILHFFPSTQGFFHKHLRGEGESFLNQHIQFFFIVTEAGTQSTKRVCSADNHRITQFGSSTTGINGIFYGFAFNSLYIDFIQFMNENLTIFRIDNGLHGSTENFYTIFLKNSVFVEGNTAVQCRLSTKGKHNAIRTFFFDDFLYKIRSDRQEINLVGNAFRSLHSSDIRVDKNGVDTFFFQGFECLAAGVVELTCLADFQCTGTE